jgi:predicted MPP superfamily phosphohydrolase
MSFRTRRVLYGTPLYMIFQFFLLKLLFSYFGGINDVYTLIITLLLGLLQSVPMLFEEKKSSTIGRLLSTIFGVWEWFLVMLFIDEVLIFIIGRFIEISKEMIILSLFLILLIGIYAYYNAHRIVIKEKILKFDNLENEYTIAHLSDVHFGSIRHKQIIEDIANKLKEVSDACDLVIISGDLADGSCAVKEDDFLSLKNVDIPIIFTSGNHDYYPGLENVHKACKNAEIRILENEGMVYYDLNIYGLSFSFGDIPMPTAEELKSFIKEDKINIVNYHVPNGWDELSDIGFNIQLSGHTHGGQFYPITFLGKYMYEGHNMGLFKKTLKNNKKGYLHVTTGVGSMDIPMRWGTNSEIVLLKLRR